MCPACMPSIAFHVFAPVCNAVVGCVCVRSVSSSCPRSQVDRYKQLLLKQRDIMIALTARLNERDEQIMALQVRQYSTIPGTMQYNTIQYNAVQLPYHLSVPPVKQGATGTLVTDASVPHQALPVVRSDYHTSVVGGYNSCISLLSTPC
jgi:hypothetical protein